MQILRDVGEAIQTLNPESLAIDLETSGFSPWKDRIAVISLADHLGNVAVLHVRGEVPARLVDFISNAGLLIGHNAVNFDGPFLALNGVNVWAPNWYDTLVGEMVISSQARHGISRKLADVLPRRLGAKAQKGTVVNHGGWMNEELTERQLDYAAGDVVHLHRLMRAQQGIAQDHGSETNALQMEMAVVPVVMRMVVNGMPLDLGALETALAKCEVDRYFAEEELQALTGTRVNMRSPKQVKELLARAGIMVDSTNYETMRSLELLDTGDSPLATAILAYRAADQPLKLYKPEWVAEHYQADGRVHARYWQCAADTGRFTSSEPNMQQVPRNMRDVFVAPPGTRLISADYSQIEVRLAAAAAKDERMLDALEREDIHTAVAAAMFDVPEEVVTREQRSFAKACSFTLMFGGGAATLYQYSRLSGGQLTIDDAQAFIAKFFLKYQGLWRYREAAQYQARGQFPVVITLANGLRRVLVGQNKTSTRILNTVIQGNAAVGLKYAMVACSKMPVGEYLSATVHDELVAVVPEESAEEMLDQLMAGMVSGMGRFTDAPIRVEGTIAGDWGKESGTHVVLEGRAARKVA